MTAEVVNELDLLYEKEEECLLLLLEARELLSEIVVLSNATTARRLAEFEEAKVLEKKRKGNLTITEIQEILKLQPEAESEDLSTQIQELKTKLMVEIRKNYELEQDLNKLDKRIALLIKNKGNLSDTLYVSENLKSKKRKSRARAEADSHPNFLKDARTMELYQELFYLLQTEPRYLAKLLYLVSGEEVNEFLKTAILALFGEAFSPREEYLILRLFMTAIQYEISRLKSVSGFLSNDTVVPKMVNLYNRRRQGMEYLRKALGPVIKSLMQNKDLNFELHPQRVWQGLIVDTEIKTGQQSTLDRNATVDQILAHPEVSAILKKRAKDLEDICQVFFDAVVNTTATLPYGLRWICKQIRKFAFESFGEIKPPGATTAIPLDEVARKQLEEDIYKVIGYFIYYSFINLAIVTPDSPQLKVVSDADLPTQTRTNLAIVSRVLQNLFHFKSFAEGERHWEPINDWIMRRKPDVIAYLSAVTMVEDPEDFLQVTKYNELTQKHKPVIQISTAEIAATHQLLAKFIENLAPEKSDPLRQILDDLGSPPEAPSDDQDREIQLTLTNRFAVAVDEGDNEADRLYAETKELVIPILRAVPTMAGTMHRLYLMDVMEAGIRYASERNDKALLSQINVILENITKLEQLGKVSKKDRYESFLHDISLEVANRAVIREQQKRELARLRHTLDELQKHQSYLDEQISQYTQYLQTCRENQSKKKGKKGNKKEGKAAKFTYKELTKRGVIVDSAVPPLSRKKTTFTIRQDQDNPSVIHITAKIAGIAVHKMKLELDDLLERAHNHINRLELDQVTLDVNMTVYMINKFFFS